MTRLLPYANLTTDSELTMLYDVLLYMSLKVNDLCSLGFEMIF